MLHLSAIQVVILSLLQGLTELFPISSLGHTVILPALLHWGNIITDVHFLPLIVALHLGTSIALLIYFWRDWLQVIKTIFNSVRNGEVKKGTDEWVGWLIITGSIPAGLVGVFLQDPLKKLFATPVIASTFLIINGIMLYAGEQLRRRSIEKKTSTNGKHKELSSLTIKDAVLVGLAQSGALIPGISRSGSTIVAGLGVGLSHEDAARFSFLLGTPIILAAALLEVPQLFGLPHSTLILIFCGMILSGITAYASTKFLMKYFESGNLKPFAYYCIGAGVISLLLFLTILR